MGAFLVALRQNTLGSACRESNVDGATSVAPRRWRSRAEASLAPAPVAPHPLLRILAHPGFELLLHLGRDPAHVVGLVATAGYLQLFELDTKSAFCPESQAARHPNAGTDPAGDHGR